MEKSWNFSAAYSEACMRNSDNSISINRLLQCFGYGRLSVYVLNSKSLLGKSKLKSFSLLIFSFDMDEAFFFLISIKKTDVDSALIKYSLFVIYY